MKIIPAVDIKDGRCVRLRQGRADDEKVYSEDPIDVAKYWAAEGAQYLHVVDLDGAFDGKPAHTKVIGQIVKAIGIPVEVGGGLRTDKDIQCLLDLGVSRAIVGTRAVSEPDALKKLVDKYGDKLAVGIDAREGMVQTQGWVKTSTLSADALAVRMDALGVSTLIYTDTSRDGMLEGTNVLAVKEVCAAVGCNVIASGGISSANDIKSLNALEADNLIGAIVGKALYEGKVSLAQLQSMR